MRHQTAGQHSPQVGRTERQAGEQLQQIAAGGVGHDAPLARQNQHGRRLAGDQYECGGAERCDALET